MCVYAFMLIHARKLWGQHVCVCMHACTHTHAHTCIYTGRRVDTHTHTCMYTHSCMQVWKIWYSDFHNDCLFFSTKKNYVNTERLRTKDEPVRFGSGIWTCVFFIEKKKTVIMEIRVNYGKRHVPMCKWYIHRYVSMNACILQNQATIHAYIHICADGRNEQRQHTYTYMHAYIHVCAGWRGFSLSMEQRQHAYTHTYIHTYIHTQDDGASHSRWNKGNMHTHIRTYIHTYAGWRCFSMEQRKFEIEYWQTGIEIMLCNVNLCVYICVYVYAHVVKSWQNRNWNNVV